MEPVLLEERPDFSKRLHEVPHKPGVYLMRDRLNRIIYVGKARDLRKRLTQHFLPSNQQRADLKNRALYDSVWDFEFHVVRNEPEALLLEGNLIKEYRPKYNISFRDDKRFLLVKVNVTDPIPRFQLTRYRKEDGCRYFGPFAHSGSLRTTLNWMRKAFGLRSCRPPEPNETDYRRCLAHIIKNCSAPCIRKVSLEEYHRRVMLACEFLEGRSPDLLKELEDEMRKAAANLDFEKAAELRNMLDDLRRTTKPMRRFTRKTLPSAVDPASDLRALADALQLSNPPVAMECFDISNISTTHIVASMVCFRNGVPERANYRRYRVRSVEGQNDFASMAEVVRRRYSRVLLEARDARPDLAEYNQEPVQDAVERVSRGDRYVRLPDLVIVDGGKGQLGAASRELERLGLGTLPIIGLAKEFEEIYRPGRPVPLRLPEDSGALQLLQRIRDEAHRFANSFHQLLMKKRIGESILDDCPGVSDTRKQKLLQRFGSVERLRKASIEQVAAVEGMSERLAETVLRFLDRTRTDHGERTGTAESLEVPRDG